MYNKSKQFNLKRLVRIFFLLSITLFSCTTKKNNKDKESALYDTLDSTSLAENPIAAIPKADSIIIKSSFDLKLEKVEDSLLAWGFTKKVEKLFTNQTDYKTHWLLKYYFDRHKIARTKRNKPVFFTPTASDWGHLKRIQQVKFTKGNGYAIEEWTFDNETAAKKWERIVFYAQYIDNYKPFRTFWAENNKLYVLVIMGSNYHHTDIVEILSGINSALLNLLTNPLSVPYFKKEAGGAHSGGAKNKAYYYLPDTTGVYYHFFIFSEVPYDKKIENVFNSLHLTTYIYGKAKDYFNANEEFIALKANQSYSILGTLNFVNNSAASLEEKYGKPQSYHNGTSIYYHNKTFLILHFSNQKVNWFKLIRTNITLDKIDQLPDELFSYGTSFSKQ